MIDGVTEAGVLRQAMRRLPVLRYAFGLSGVGAALSLIRSFLPDVNVPAIFGVLIAFLLVMVVLIIVSVIAGTASRLSNQAQLIAWSVTLVLIALMGFTLTALVFGWPDRYARLILPATEPIVTAPPQPSATAAPAPPTDKASLAPSTRATPASTAVKPSSPVNQAGGMQAQVYYYAKAIDGDRVRRALRGSGISFTERPTHKVGKIGTNSVVCTPDISGVELQKVLRALRANGVEIRIVRQSDNPSKFNRIEVLTASWEDGRGAEYQLMEPPLTDDQLFAVTGCPRDLRNLPEPSGVVEQ